MLQAESFEESTISALQALTQRIQNHEATAISAFIDSWHEERLIRGNAPLRAPKLAAGESNPDITNCLKVIESQLLETNLTSNYRGYLLAWLAAFYRERNDKANWYQYASRANDLKNPQASYLLGCYHQLQSPAHENAFKFYSAAAEREHPYAAYELGLLHFPKKNSANTDATMSLRYFRSAYLKAMPQSSLRKYAEVHLKRIPINPDENYIILTYFPVAPIDNLIRLLNAYPWLCNTLVNDERFSFEEKEKILCQFSTENAVIAIVHLLNSETPQGSLYAAILLMHFFKDVIVEREKLILFLLSRGHMAISNGNKFLAKILHSATGIEGQLENSVLINVPKNPVLLPASELIKLADEHALPIGHVPLDQIITVLHENAAFADILQKRYRQPVFFTYEEIICRGNAGTMNDYIRVLANEVTAIQRIEHLPMLLLQRDLDRVLNADLLPNPSPVDRLERILIPTLKNGLQILFDRVQKQAHHADTSTQYLTINKLTALFKCAQELVPISNRYIQYSHTDAPYNKALSEFKNILDELTPPFYIRLSPAMLLEKIKRRMGQTVEQHPEEVFTDNVSAWINEFENTVSSEIKRLHAAQIGQNAQA